MTTATVCKPVTTKNREGWVAKINPTMSHAVGWLCKGDKTVRKFRVKMNDDATFSVDIGTGSGVKIKFKRPHWKPAVEKPFVGPELKESDRNYIKAAIAVRLALESGKLRITEMEALAIYTLVNAVQGVSANGLSMFDGVTRRRAKELEKLFPTLTKVEIKFIRDAAYKRDTAPEAKSNAGPYIVPEVKWGTHYKSRVFDVRTIGVRQRIPRSRDELLYAKEVYKGAGEKDAVLWCKQNGDNASGRYVIVTPGKYYTWDPLQSKSEHADIQATINEAIWREIWDKIPGGKNIAPMDIVDALRKHGLTVVRNDLLGENVSARRLSLGLQ